MAKAGLVFANNDADTRLNSNSSMQDGVVTIPKLLHFRVPDGSNPRSYSDLDVYKHPNFPQMYSALPEDPRYKFYGNATVRHDLDDGRYFTAELEYSTQSPNAKDEDGNEVTSETKPWKLRPDNISITYPEEIESFEAAYNSKGERYNEDGKVLVPVQNTAGDPFIAERTVRNMELSFSFAAKKWNPNDSLKYGGSINSKAITVCGITIPAQRGLLRPPECEYITTYEDGSSTIKWQYWNVRVSIFIAAQKYGLLKRILNVGDKARFKDMSYSDDLIKNTITLNGNTEPSQICCFRPYEKISMGENKYSFIPSAIKKIFCSWQQFINFRSAAITWSLYLQEKDQNFVGGIDPQCEQLSQIPLDINGYVDEEAIKNKKYLSIAFRQYPAMSWGGLNLPKKGVKW